jgi:endonuclease/exonuclease/phosphatase (EEP) superfamily protein YafD
MPSMARHAGRTAGARSLDVGTGLAVGGLTALVALRVLPRDVHRIQIALEGARDAALTTAPVLAAVAAIRRRPVTAVLAVALTVQSHRDRRRRRVVAPSPDAGTMRVVSANLLGGNRRVEDLGRELIADAADVVVVQELTPQHADGLRVAGLLDAMPHHVLDPQLGYHGSGLYARWPITDAEVFDVCGMGMAAATVHGPVGAVQVVAVHVINPARDAMMPVWRAQLDWLAEHMRQATLPVVLAGDYNATMDHRGLRVLSAAGLVDAHDAAGRGLGLTWPRRSYRGAGRWPALPIMRLDHVFVPPTLGVRAVRTATSAGSDHRRVIADLSRIAPI